jgi:hypothetical protein
MKVSPQPSSLHAFTPALVAEHGGRASISVEEAANVVGIGKEQAYSLAASERFPVFGVTSAGSKRESMRVLIPALVQWMLDGGTRQYDEPRGVKASDAPAPGRAKRARLDSQRQWLAAQQPAA